MVKISRYLINVVMKKRESCFILLSQDIEISSQI